METKICSKCKTPKNISEFHRASNQKDGHTNRCKECISKRGKELYYKDIEKSRLKLKIYAENNPEKMKAYRRKANLKRKDKIQANHREKFYGISTEEYLILYENQHGVCAICGNPETSSAHPGSNEIRTLSIDHDHVTGKIRGLLCHKCNLGLGHFNDSIKLLSNAVNYLKS